jgi:hypothetical protein
MISKDMLGKIIDSLSSMINYADDGAIPRDDEDYKDFFESVDEACDILDKLNEIYSLSCYSFIDNKQVKEIWDRKHNYDEED